MSGQWGFWIRDMEWILCAGWNPELQKKKKTEALSSEQSDGYIAYELVSMFTCTLSTSEHL